MAPVVAQPVMDHSQRIARARRWVGRARCPPESARRRRASRAVARAASSVSTRWFSPAEAVNSDGRDRRATAVQYLLERLVVATAEQAASVDADPLHRADV
jgi:hypothetical protein